MARKRNYVEETEKIEEKQGKPWKNVAYCDNFCDADKKRLKYLSENENIQVKVKRCGVNGAKFVVKLRKDPLFEEKVEKKDNKDRKKGKNRKDQR